MKPSYNPDLIAVSVLSKQCGFLDPILFHVDLIGIVFSRRFPIKGKMPENCSDCFFLQTTILTLIGPLFLQFLQSSNLTILTSNLKYCRKSFRRSVFTSSKKLKGTKGYSIEYFRLCETFFRKNFPQSVPLQFFWSFPTERMLKNPKDPLSVFSAL